VWIEKGTLSARVTRATDEERRWLTDFLTFKDANARFSGAGVTRLYNVFNHTFPAGLYPNVESAARAEGFTVEAGDKRSPPVAVDREADLAWLRPYQREAVDRVVGKTRGILWLPTGAGKTEIAVALSRALPCRWLFLAHRSTLMGQAADRYEQRSPGLRAGRIGEGTWDVREDDTFIVATFQTLSKAIDKGDPRATELLQSVQGLIVDECHVLPAGSFYRIAMATPQAYYRVGLSGTPLARGDRRSLLAIAALGPIIYRLKPDVLIDAGVLARPRITMVRVDHVAKEPTWQGVYGAHIVRGARRNAAVVEAVRRAEKPCMVFVKEVSHGHLLERALLNAGISTGFVWGSHGTDARKTRVKDLVAGRIDALVCSVIFQEGVDVPELRSVVIASAGKSAIAAIQRVGRGMRVSKDKTDFEVYDFSDRGCGCDKVSFQGERHSGCKWFEKHTRERANAYKREGYSISEEAWPVGARPGATAPKGALVARERLRSVTSKA
jgi:superfamily II DNA or RNA helicase